MCDTFLLRLSFLLKVSLSMRFRGWFTLAFPEVQYSILYTGKVMVLRRGLGSQPLMSMLITSNVSFMPGFLIGLGVLWPPLEGGNVRNVPCGPVGVQRGRLPHTSNSIDVCVPSEFGVGATSGFCVLMLLTSLCIGAKF